MSYIDNVVRELRALLTNGRRPGQFAIPPDEIEAVVRFVRARVAESYENGMAAAERMRAEQRGQVRRGLTCDVGCVG
jgi:hypothetical protein